MVCRVGEPLPAELRRASHADREHVADRLREAAGDGRLSIDELEERLDAAFAARTYAELGVADLRPARPAGLPAPAHRPRPACASGCRPG